MKNFRRNWLKGWLALSSLEGLAALAWLACIPAEAVSGRALSYSPTRLVMMGMLLAGAGFFAWAGWHAWRGSPRMERLRSRLELFIRVGDHRLWLAWTGLSSLAVCAYLSWLIETVAFPLFQATLVRAQPAVMWAGMLVFQAGAAAMLVSWPKYRDERTRMGGALLKGSGWVFLGLLALAVFMRLSGAGLTRDTEWWHPNSPLLLSQILASLSAAFLAFMVLRRRTSPWADGWMALVIWLAAMVLWGLEPLNPSFFNPQPVGPNNVYYPYSDARDYDLAAQYALIGQRLGNGGLFIRPFFSFLIALNHLVSGQDYGRMIFVQMAALACYPVTLFFLGRKLHSRLAGFLAAVVVILRERNAIALAGMIPGGHSHLKLLMSDIPATFGLALFTLLFALWLEQPVKRRRLPLILGGGLGLLTMIRSQIILLVPIVAAAAVLLHLRRPRLWLSATVMLILGEALIVGPWLVRNYAYTGMWELEKAPSFHLASEAAYYTGSSDGTQIRPGERGDAYNARMNRMLRDYALAHPLEVLRFTANHFLHNEVNTVLLLPLAADRLNLKAYVTGFGFWFGDSTLSPGPGEVGWLCLNLALVALGMVAALRLRGRVALAPWVVHFGYNLSTALARRSGGRYFLPGDWVGLFFFALGLAQLLVFLVWWCGGQGVRRSAWLPAMGKADSEEPEKDDILLRLWGRFALVSAGILLVGLVPPAFERVIPPRYAALDNAGIAGQLSRRWESLPERSSDLARLEAWLEAGGAEGYWGRGLYPSYFKAGEGIRVTEDNKDFARLRFRLLGPRTTEVILLREEMPAVFPNAADVVAVGCPGEGFLDAAAVVVLGEGAGSDLVYWGSSAGEPGCPKKTSP